MRLVILMGKKKEPEDYNRHSFIIVT